MAHHSQGDLCPSCEEKLKKVHPILCIWFRNNVKVKHPDAHISWGFRNEEEQTWAYNDGKSKAKWPESKHNRTDPTGIPRAEALDLFRLSLAGIALFPMSWYRQIADEIQGDPIQWGGTFHAIIDLDHFQVIESRVSVPQTDDPPAPPTNNNPGPDGAPAA